MSTRGSRRTSSSTVRRTCWGTRSPRSSSIPPSSTIRSIRAGGTTSRSLLRKIPSRGPSWWARSSTDRGESSARRLGGVAGEHLLELRIAAQAVEPGEGEPARRIAALEGGLGVGDGGGFLSQQGVDDGGFEGRGAAL